MDAKFAYAIKFVADMAGAVAFHRDTFGLEVKFETAEWTEFRTGDVTLALHPANAEHPAGSVQLGFSTAGLSDLYAARAANGLSFIEAPRLEHGTLLSQVLDCEGASVSLSGKP